MAKRGRKKTIEEIQELSQFLRTHIRLRDGSYMDLDEWTGIPYKGTSMTEDAEFEVVPPKQIDEPK